jgi:predicted neutral ceramidase superfamily lipid hydrolase
MADPTTTMTAIADVPAGVSTGTAADALNNGLSEAVSSTVSSAFTLSQALAITAVALLVFVSAGVLYLSTVEWRDRRRRSQAEPARR